MILDQLATFFDERDPALTLATATPSKAVNVPALAGRLDPIHCFIDIKATVATSKSGSVAVALQEADDEAFTVPAVILALTFPLVAGVNDVLEFFDLPAGARKEFVRLSVTATSNDSAAVVKVRAGVTQDVYRPYERGQYRDKGRVVF